MACRIGTTVTVKGKTLIAIAVNDAFGEPCADCIACDPTSGITCADLNDCGTIDDTHSQINWAVYKQ